MAPQKSKKPSKSTFFVDCAILCGNESERILDIKEFRDFLKARIKVGGKAGNLGTAITVGIQKTKIAVTSEIPISKKYIKYLTKKFITKTGAREYIRVVMQNKDSYELRFYDAREEDEEEN